MIFSLRRIAIPVSIRCSNSEILSIIPRHISVVLESCPTVDMDGEVDWQQIVNNQQPILFKNYCKSWPAVNKNHEHCWESVEYMKQISSEHSQDNDCSEENSVIRTKYKPFLIPIEYGGNYMSKLMKIVEVDYLDFISYLYSTNNFDTSMTPPHLYFAQNQLCDYFPSLLRDIEQNPIITNYLNRKHSSSDVDYKSLTSPIIDCNDSLHLYRINLWMSKAGVDSPCHVDPYENLLCQIVGRKKILLFSPQQSKHMKPYPGNQKNTSQINFKKFAYKTKNQFSTYGMTDDHDEERGDGGSYATQDLDKIVLCGTECILESGDALYIPYKWWHYCEAVECNRVDSNQVKGFGNNFGNSNNNSTTTELPCISVNYWWV